MVDNPVVGAVVINAEDDALVAGFWKEYLGVEAEFSVPGVFTWLAPQREGGVRVGIQAVPDPTPGRRRVHMDTYAADVDAAVALARELGGSHLEDHEIDGFAWKVMADPEGNEFCIVPAH